MTDWERIVQARTLAWQVAWLYGLSEAATAQAIESAASAPVRATRCYQSILESLKPR